MLKNPSNSRGLGGIIWQPGWKTCIFWGENLLCKMSRGHCEGVLIAFFRKLFSRFWSAPKRALHCHPSFRMASVEEHHLGYSQTPFPQGQSAFNNWSELVYKCPTPCSHLGHFWMAIPVLEQPRNGLRAHTIYLCTALLPLVPRPLCNEHCAQQSPCHTGFFFFPLQGSQSATVESVAVKWSGALTHPYLLIVRSLGMRERQVGSCTK